MLEQAHLTRTLQGTPVVPGTAYGRVVRPVPAPVLPAPVPVHEQDREAEAERFAAAAAAVADRLAARAAAASGVSAEVLQATSVLARDRGLTASVIKAVRSGTDAPHATSAAVDQFAVLFRQMGGLMAERVTDLYDLRDRIVAELTGQAEPGIPTPAEPSVLVADDLAPADTAGLDPLRVTGLATRLGGPTSHTAIIARQLGIPCIVAVTGLDEVSSDAYVLVDGTTGQLQIDPDPAEAERAVTTWRAQDEAVARWRGPGRTADGHAVQVLANVQDGAGARVAAATEAEGVGLFRTELCFLSADREPSVEQQAVIYAEVLDAFAGRRSSSARSTQGPTSRSPSPA